MRAGESLTEQLLVTYILGLEKPGKRDRTRRQLAEVALDLFEAQGYEQTTTAAIADVAGVSEMTVFRHYPSKDRLLLDDPYDPHIAAAISAQPTELTALERVTSGIRRAWREVPAPAEAAVRRRLRVAARTPSLTGAVRANTQTTERAVAQALVDTGTELAVARIVAAAVLAALMESLMTWASADDGTPLGDAIMLALRVLESPVR